MALRLLSDKLMGTAAKFYQRAVAAELTKTGEFHGDHRGVFIVAIDFSRTNPFRPYTVSCNTVKFVYGAGILILSSHIIFLDAGLRYEDLLNEDENDIGEALSLATADLKTARTRRIKRALDLNIKQKNFLDYAPDVNQDTFKSEIYDDILKIRARDQEIALLNAHKH
jgi:ubiquinol-cytochrome c reductase subunit 7